MPELVFRPYEDRDVEGYESVRSLTYNDGLPIPEDRRQPKFSSRFVAESEGSIAGVFNVLSMNATRGPALLPCAGVAGVGVSPDLRRGGVGRQMMAWSVRHFAESGFPMASLYAYREPFYGKNGYAAVGKRIRLTVPMHRFPEVTTTLPIRRLTPSDWAQLHPCYAGFGHQRAGVHLRSELMWERVLHESKPLTIYAAGDPVEGYIAVSHQVAFWNEQFISEVAWSTAEGYRGALAAIKRIGINKASTSWFEPSDSPFYSQYLDQGVEAKLERPVMFRVCDVPGALRLLNPTGKGSFTLAIHDEQVPNNIGPWQVAWANGLVEVTKTDGAADLETDVPTFTQAFMGEPNLIELIGQGRVVVNTSHATAQASELLPPLPVYCGDFF